MLLIKPTIGKKKLNEKITSTTTLRLYSDVQEIRMSIFNFNSMQTYNYSNKYLQILFFFIKDEEDTDENR